MEPFKHYFNEVLKKDIKVGDMVRNINPECEHYGTEGVVINIIRRPEVDNDRVSNNHNMPGNDCQYKVLNKTKTAKPGDVLRKSLEQVALMSHNI